MILSYGIISDGIVISDFIIISGFINFIGYLDISIDDAANGVSNGLVNGSNKNGAIFGGLPPFNNRYFNLY